MMVQSSEPSSSAQLSPAISVPGDANAVSTSMKRKSKAKDEKTCGVCGDKALGYNFNAITCESCKAFFRRNALKTIVCLFDNDCVVDIRTRRFCPACRIKKCYNIGMNRDMILDDGERKKRMTKLISNRVKQPSTPESIANVPIKKEVELPVETVTQSRIPISETNQPTTSPLSMPHDCNYGSIFKHVSKDQLPSDPSMYFHLSTKDNHLLNNITMAYRNTLAAMPERGLHADEEGYQNATDLVNHSEMVVRKLIQFVKDLGDFRHLTQENQVACLKACIMNTLLLRSALFYNMETDSWVTPKGEIPSSILKDATGFVELHNSHVGYCRRVKSLAMDDLNIYALMQVLIIYDPSGHNISSRELVSSMQDNYSTLLKHYLESCYSFTFAKDCYVGVLNRLCDLRLLSHEHAKILM